MPGPAPKPAHLRQRTNRKAGAATLVAVTAAEGPPLPDLEIDWHPLTVASWQRAWRSEMASQWLPTDGDGLGRLAVLWDQFYKHPEPKVLGEIRLQEQRYGLSPLDRSRLSWEISRAEDVARKQPAAAPPRAGRDPRRLLVAVK